ncbi:MAG: hypothetical protein K2X01_09000 [Cyanobacteria bacterium]|nr:hypothetical protein [Cyanobacteriota bacterium]
MHVKKHLLWIAPPLASVMALVGGCDKKSDSTVQDTPEKTPHVSVEPGLITEVIPKIASADEVTAFISQLEQDYKVPSPVFRNIVAVLANQTPNNYHQGNPAQLTPGTIQRWLNPLKKAYKNPNITVQDVLQGDWKLNLTTGIAHLRDLYQDDQIGQQQSWRQAITAYIAGPEAAKSGDIPTWAQPLIDSVVQHSGLIDAGLINEPDKQVISPADAPQPKAVSKSDSAAQRNNVLGLTCDYGDLVTKEFGDSVCQIAAELNTNPDWLMWVISFETQGTFKASSQNKKSSATGLLQWTKINYESWVNPKTKKPFTRAEFAGLTEMEQLRYVRAWLLPYKGKLTSPGQVYMAVVAPSKIGSAADRIIYDVGSPQWKANINWRKRDPKTGMRTGPITVRQLDEVITTQGAYYPQLKRQK